MASQNGHVEIVEKLLQHGATVDLQMKVLACKYVSGIYYIDIVNTCLYVHLFHFTIYHTHPHVFHSSSMYTCLLRATANVWLSKQLKNRSSHS